ncbi:MAG: polyprenyl synthetase family protein [Candidatus Gracilibacteria bacterium]|nr:polyprenyl synthetase family protein [Candidatus Gracilibacteria bacterium]
MLPTWYKKYREFSLNLVIDFLEDYFGKNTLNKPLQEIKEVTIYACQNGKKLRPILALEIYLLNTNKTIEEIKKEDDIVKFMIALELVHSYSLVHDDLPAMDNDTLRRGNPTVWSKYSEYIAILVGDLLNSLAFEVLSEIKNPEISQKLIKLLSRNVGFYGMLGGQVEDMYYEINNSDITKKDLDSLHNKKTGALIKSAIIGGAILAGSSDEEIRKLEKFGTNLGLTFQIKDDLLDVEGSSKETGKSVGGENKGYVYFLGLDKTKQELDRLTKENLNLIKDYNSEKLNWLVDFIKNRKK